MKRNLSDYLVALAVIACSAVLLGALTLALTGYQVHKSTRTLEIDFSDVAGIKLHSEVRYAGAPAGRVIAMRPLTDAERAGSKSAVRVTVSINEDVPPLPEDVQASLGSDTLLSEKFVGLSAGTPGKPLLANGEVIRGTPGFNIDQLAQQLGPIISQANDLLAELRNQVGIVMPKISQLSDNTNTAAKSANELLKNIDQFIANTGGDLHGRLDQLQGVIKNLDGVLAKGGDVLIHANGFIGTTDKDLDARMKELRVVLENLKVITTHAKAITETLGERPSRLIWGSKTNKLVPEQTILKSSEPVPAKAQ